MFYVREEVDHIFCHLLLRYLVEKSKTTTKGHAVFGYSTTKTMLCKKLHIPHIFPVHQVV